MGILKKAIYVVVIVAISLTIFASAVKAEGTKLKVTADTLNLREKASTSSEILALLSNGEECELIEEEGDWYKVKYKSQTGYVSKEYVKKIETTNSQEEESDVQEPSNGTNNDVQNNDQDEGEESTLVTGKLSKKTPARILPLIHSSLLETLNKGTEITIIEELNDWSYISTDEISAWIRSDSIEGKKTETKVEDDSDNKNIDAEKDENNEEQDDENNVVQNDNQDNNKNNENAENKDNETTNSFEEKVMYVNDLYVNLRKKPSTSADVIMVVELNTKLTVIGEEGDWYKVKTSEGNAYVSKELLSDNKKTTTSRGTSEVRGATANIKTENLEDSDKNSTENKKNTNSNSSEVTTSNKGEEIVEYAKKFLGVPYVYGGASTSGFDCSGFTMYVYKKFGISMRHGAQAQAKLGTAIKADKSSASSLKKNLKAGDLVFFLDYETMDEIGHCGIYIGDGKFIHASSGSGYCVKINSLLPGEYYNTRYCAARRVI